MGEGFNVNVDGLRAHAQTVGDIAATVRSVAGGAQDSVSGGAFGQIAEFFASAITGAADQVRQSMHHAGETVDDVRTGLSQAADGYQAIEEHQVQVFTAGLTGGGPNTSGQWPKSVIGTGRDLKTMTDAMTNTVRTRDDAHSTVAGRTKQ